MSARVILWDYKLDDVIASAENHAVASHLTLSKSQSHHSSLSDVPPLILPALRPQPLLPARLPTTL